jgi:hypothetical protein
MTYGISYSLLSGNIYVGSVAKSGVTWTSKEEQNLPAMIAVAEYVERQHNGDVVLTPTNGDGSLYRITVEKLEPNH